MKNRGTRGPGGNLLVRKKKRSKKSSSLKNKARTYLASADTMFGNQANLKTDSQSALGLVLKRNELLRLASDIAKLGYFELNRKTLEMTWSSQLLEIFDIKRGCEPLMGKGSCDYIFKEDYAEVLEAFGKAIGGIYIPVTYRIKTGSGQIKNLQTNFSALSKKVDADIVFGTTQDITEIKKKEEEIANKEKELRFITDFAPVLIFKTDNHGIIQYVNGNRRKWISKKITDIFHRENRKEANQKIEQAIKNDKPVNFEVKAATLSQKSIWYHTTVKRVDYADQTMSLIFIVQDITASKEVKQIVSDAIAEAEIRERKRIAADLHDGVCQHLATIHLSIDTLQKNIKKQDTDTARFVAETKELVTETLTMARKVSHDLMPVDIFNSGFLKGLKAVISRLNRVDKIKYTLNVWGKERKLPGNVSNNLYRIVQEFIHNSEKHADATEITLLIRYRQKFMYLLISDNGKGFNPEKIKKVEGIGLKNIISRILTFTTDYEFKAAEGKGVSLEINIPL